MLADPLKNRRRWQERLAKAGTAVFATSDGASVLALELQ